jgi:hypothetical protein
VSTWLSPIAIGIANELAIEFDDFLTRPVIDIQHHGLDFAAKVLAASCRELYEILDSCTAEAVERLIIVAHDTNVAMPPGEEEEKALLDRVRVLVLVDDYILEDPGRLLISLYKKHGLLLKQRQVCELGPAVVLE